MADEDKKDSQQAKPKGKPRQVKNIIPLGSQEVAVYATPKVGRALDEITEDMTLYNGVRLAQVMEAVYLQGQKDGARAAIGTLEQALAVAKEGVPHRNPGKPPKPPKAVAKKINGLTYHSTEPAQKAAQAGDFRRYTALT